MSKKFPRLGLDVTSEWYNEEDREDRNTRSDCTFKGRTIGTLPLVFPLAEKRDYSRADRVVDASM